MESKLFLELGQIIQISAPNNLVLDNKIYLVDYLDDNLIKLINDTDFTIVELTIKGKKLTDESIEEISILANPGEKGYARQNDLIPNKFVSIELGGNIPKILNGQITDLDEDQIELTEYGSGNKFYIDFGYKGIPLDIPIISIKDFFPQEEEKDQEEESRIIDSLEEEDSDDDLDLILDSETRLKNTEDLFYDIDDIEVLDEEKLDEITEMTYVDDKNKRFGIDTQTQDILDELLAEYPSNQRTPEVLNKIHIIIERFKQLRKKFSSFDEIGNAEKIKIKGANHKPLIESLKKLDKKLYWLIPVSRNSHKIFDASTKPDEIYEDAQIGEFKYDTSELMDYFNNYKTNNVPDSQNKYNYLMGGLNSYLTPFLDTNNNDNIIIKKEVNDNFDVLINNSGSFLSTMVKARENKDALLINEEYVIDKYNLGLNKLHNPDIKNKHSKDLIVPLTGNDKINLLGFISLPEPYIQYSRINLRTTSIYKKANLSIFNYFLYDILNKSKKINEKIIKEGEEVDNNKPIDENLFRTKMYYNFDERRRYIDRDEKVIADDVYENFLDIMVPQTKSVFNILKKYIKNGTSFTKIIEYLEPFLIYNDDITFQQYDLIKDFIYDEIVKYKKVLYQNNKDRIKFIRSNKDYFIPTILKQIIKKDYLDICEKIYYNLKDDLETDESLKRILNFDNGRLYNTVLSLSELTFGQPISIEEKIKEELEQTSVNIEEDKKEDKGNCNKYKLVKRYQDLDELIEDNNSSAFVDKKYDDTPYDIGNDWISKHSDEFENSEDMKSALKQFLIINNGVEDLKSQRDAEAMIDKVRLVNDGEYAILDVGDNDIKYYIRQNNIWIYDKTLLGKNIDEINFCNLKQNCVKIKETCTNLDTSKKMLKKNILEQIVKRFDDELQLGIQELKTNLLNEFNYRKQNIVSLKTLKINKFLKKDKYRERIANTLAEEEIVVSPYELLRDEILSQNDIIKKFDNILKFIYQYCRIADDDEDDKWYYCIDTNIKLLPNFFFDLAVGFQKKQYIKALDKIYKDRGTLSDDGDKWVDKYSGYYISNITLDTTEGYDKSGYKIKSRDIMEESLSDKLKSSTIRNIKDDYSTKEARNLKKMIKTFDDKLFISTESQHNFIIKTTIECINQYAPDEITYKTAYAKKVKEGKKLKTYEKKYDEILLYSLISAYIIAVQSVIPGVISKKAYGTCKKSFSGYPIDGNSDLSFLEYFSCMLFHLRRNDRPWNIIPKGLSGKRKRLKKYEEIMEKWLNKIKKWMDEKILIIDDVSMLLKLKNEWKKRGGEVNTIMDEFDVQKWSEFLPPLKPVIVRSVNNISNTFENTLISRIKKNDSQQFAHLWNLYGKIKSYSFSIIQSIQRVIDKEPLILETKSGIPFVENACCNEGEPNTNLYFSQKDSNIQKHNNIIKKLSQLYYKYKNSSKPSFFNIAKSTKLDWSQVNFSEDFSKSTIYLAFIKFCKFNSGIELDENLKRLCINNSCKFNNFDSIEEKILSMENDNLIYNKESLNILLNIINRGNILKYDLDPPITTEKLYLEETIKYLLDKENTICDRNLLEKLKELVDRFDVSVTDKNDIVINEFKIYLNGQINDMISNIEKNVKFKNMNILKLFNPTNDVNSKIKNKKRGQFILNWKGDTSWMIKEEKDDIDDNYISKKDEIGIIIFNMLRELITLIIKVYPTIILNEIDYNNRYIPKHWLKGSKKFSETHSKDIKQFMLKDGQDFSKFYGDERLKVVLNYVLKNNEDMLMLLNSIPFYTDINNNENINNGETKGESKNKKCSSIFDGEIIKKLGYYFLLSSFSLYISSFQANLNIPDSDDDELYASAKQKIIKTTNDLLQVYVKKIEEYKKLLDVTSEDINKNVLKSKTKEKEKMVKRLGNLTVEERQIENLMKSYSLGHWGIGKSKAIFEYDSKQYDKERETMEKEALLEMKTGGLDDVSEFNREIYNLDIAESDYISNRIENEVNNLNYLPEDDDFGDEDGHDGNY